MLDFLKHIFRHRPVTDDLAAETPAPASVAGQSSTAPRPPTRSEPRPGEDSAGRDNGNGNSVEVSLQAVFNAFPPQLKGRIRQLEVGGATVSVTLDKVLSQLSRGTVKITFGELRRAAPQLFAPGSDCDQVQVNLPLNEILLQVNPALLVRRQNQKQIQVPDEIRSPFGDRGDGLIFSLGQAKPQTPAPPRVVAARKATSPAQPRAVAPPTQTPPVPPRVVAAPKPASPATAQPKPAPPASLQATNPPAPTLAPLQPIPFRGSGSIGSTPTPPPPTARSAGSPPASAAPPALRGVGAATPPSAPRQSASSCPPSIPREPISQPARPATEEPSLNVALMNLAQGWPESLRHEIGQLNLTDAKVALPVEMVEQALKHGRVAYSWKVLRSWIKPAPLPTVSVHDNAMLELPLKVIAPLFLHRHKDTAKPQQKVALDDNIPNLFFGFPQPGTPPAAEATVPAGRAVTKPVDTNYLSWQDSADPARADETEYKRKVEPSPGTSFVTRYATPNEVVSRAAALDGVAGALIALPDGLMVASRLSSDLNGDTLAAFLPQIFGKVSQCTKELRMGDLNNLNFTVGNVPWKIFRVNAIFFAAFGRPGQPLPTGQLAALAAELDRKKTVS